MPVLDVDGTRFEALAAHFEDRAQEQRLIVEVCGYHELPMFTIGYGMESTHPACWLLVEGFQCLYFHACPMHSAYFPSKDMTRFELALTTRIWEKKLDVPQTAGKRYRAVSGEVV